MSKVNWMCKTHGIEGHSCDKLLYTLGFNHNDGWIAQFVDAPQWVIVSSGDLVDVLAACEKHHAEQQSRERMERAYPMLLEFAKLHHEACQARTLMPIRWEQIRDEGLRAAGVIE